MLDTVILIACAVVVTVGYVAVRRAEEGAYSWGTDEPPPCRPCAPPTVNQPTDWPFHVPPR